MKIIVQFARPLNMINMEDLNPDPIIGGINKINKRKCFIFRKSESQFHCLAADLSSPTTVGIWDGNIFSTINEALLTINHSFIEWYVFDTQKELFEWLLKP